MIVGAGFAGSVVAERLASQLGKRVLILDRRPHSGGNADDCYDDAGVLIHQYGPHIFHTNAPRIADYLSQFTQQHPYAGRCTITERALMHRTIEITVVPTATDPLLQELVRIDGVIGLTVSRGASHRPVGDVVTVHGLNRDTDEVLKCVRLAEAYGPVSVVTAEVASIIDPAKQELIDNDVDEATWEEMETGLRHQGRVTVNYLTLMALGGAIAVIGLVSEPVPQVTAFIASSIIAPGFEPIAKIPLGIVLQRPNVVRRGLVSMGSGYLVLIGAAILMFLLLRLFGVVTVEQLTHNPEVERLAHPSSLDLLVSACGLIAGVTMIAAYRRSVIAGPLIATVLIPAAALVGAAIAAGQGALIEGGLKRLAIDVVLLLVLGAGVFLIKQITVHRRTPLV